MAERDLGDAQKNATRAQLDLTTARKQAKEDLEDLANQVIDAQDSQRESVLQLQQAKITLDETMRSPAASQAARAQAQLSYDEAVQHSKEQQLQLDRLRDKQALAARAGVDGSQTVIDAQDKLTQAQRDVGDRTQAVTDAQVQGHRQVALAVRKIGDEQRAVADAQQQQAKTAYQGTEQVQKAQEALAQAMRSAGAAAAATANALAKLAPNARAFVDEVIHLKGAWESLRFDVQQRLFDGLAGSLRTAAGSILPVLHTQLVQSAGAVNDMGRGVLETAGHMASSGVLGQALGSANRGLESLTRIPAQVIQGFLQIGAAAGPAFDRITGGVGRLADSISQRLNKAFSSGGMQQAINTAIGLLSQLGTVAGNLVGLVGEVLSTAQASGGGFVNTLVQISGALKVAFATPAVQEGLRSLFSLTSQIASTAAPLLLQALQVIAPVLSTLGPPLQVLVTTLGAALRPVIAALGPVLVTAAQAIGQLVIAAAPLLPVIGQLAAALLPSLTPLLAGAGQIFQQLAPLVAAVAGAIGQLLGPVLAVLPQLITPAVSLLTTLTGAILPPLTQLISQLPLGQLGQSFAQIAVALAPVLTQLAVLAGQYLQAMMPLLLPIITAFSRLAAIFSGELARVVQAVVVPALRMLADLLSGNLSGAVSNAGQLLSGLAQTVTQVFTQLPGEVLGVLGDLAGQLFTAGGRIIDGLINGIKGKIGDVKDAVGGLLQGARNLLPFSPAKEGPFSGSGWTLYSGQSISTALADGILSGRDRVRTATRSLVGTAHAGLGGGQFGGLAMAGAGGVPGGGFHIQNYYESETGSARSTAEELMWLGKGRG
jgi:phage-related protein